LELNAKKAFQIFGITACLFEGQRDDLGFSRNSMNSDSTEGARFYEALAWLEVNKKRVAIGLVVLLVIGFGAYVWSYMAEQKEVEASSALLALRPPVNAPTNQPPVSSAEFLKVAQAHAGTAAADRAILLAAGALFAEGKYAEAQTQFERLAKEHAGSPWAPEAAYGIAASLESQGKRDDALTAYQRVITTYQNEPVATQARLALARIYETKNQPDLALKQYDDLTHASSGGMNMTQQEAMMRRERLLKKFPNLVKPATNAPAITTGATNGSVTMTTPKTSGTNLPLTIARPASPATNQPAKK
jgi:predicted negative regulator of RcsB-dependent stress response